MRITDFLKRADLTDSELSAALKVVRAFKACESFDEWLGISFDAWAKLDQLEECLAHLVEGEPLADDTIAYLAEAPE